MSRQTKFACQTQAVAAAAILAVQFFALQSDNAHAQMRGAAAQTSAVTGSKAAAKPIAGTVPTAPATCTAPAELARFDRPLIHTMRRVANGQPLTIVAIGSSSTAGAGASSPDATYPSRLAVELRTRFPGRDITVLNRGVNGEETNNMMARFAADVLAAHPQLVLWQIGTNSVLRDHPLNPHAVQLLDGIEELKAAGADVVLIDPQFAPAVLAKSETQGMVEQIALAAKQEDVGLFQRFAVMREWHDVQHLSFDTFVSPDHLHMNDWSYACLAKLLGGAIAEAATRPITAASVHPATISAKRDVH
jgi:lysophospholipase L1-like esterase